MKTLIKHIALVIGLLLLAPSLRGATFIGTTSSYISNSADGGLWTFVISNQVVGTWRGADGSFVINSNLTTGNALKWGATGQHYATVSNGFWQLWVSNTLIMTVDTNTMRVGFNTNNIARSFVVVGQKPATNDTSNGTTASTTGRIQLVGGAGGESAAGGSPVGGVGGVVEIIGGLGGSAPNGTTNVTGGGGGNLVFTGGTGGAGSAASATNAATGGAGGDVSISSGAGGNPGASATNVVGGSGGDVTFTANSGATPSAGWARKGGNGGGFTMTGGSGRDSVRTNGGNGGSFTMNAGASGGATTTPGSAGTPGNFVVTGGNSGSAVAGGNPQPGGQVRLTGGNGSTGDTNSDGGHVFIAGGAPGSGAVPGNVVLARTSAGVTRGAGVVIGISNSAVLTNVMFVRTNLDFPSTLAQTDTDIPVLTVAGRTNGIVNVGPPPSALLSGVVWSGFCSNGIVFVRCSVYGALAKDPGIGDFEVEVKTYR